jgi:tRNA-splicing endonuclease subunit Sen54
MELEALDLLDHGDRTVSLKEMYEKVDSGMFGCCWELFEAYRHLKSLGYIIARHDVAWSLKSIRSFLIFSDLEGTEERKELVDMVSKFEVSIDKLFGDLKINDFNPDFDVYLPNNRFRKSYPGDPHFLLHLSRYILNL